MERDSAGHQHPAGSPPARALAIGTERPGQTSGMTTRTGEGQTALAGSIVCFCTALPAVVPLAGWAREPGVGAMTFALR